MTEERRLLIKALSLLLRYPDAALPEVLDRMDRVMDEIPECRSADLIRTVVSRLRQWPLLRLQEEYSRVFDLSSSTSLHLTYHKWGDGRERGHALARLAGIYRTAGLIPVGHELPDYLPLVLEFVSVSSEESFRNVWQEVQEEVESLASRVKASGCVYGDLFEALLETMDHRNAC